MRGKKCCTQRIKKKKFCFFSRKQFWAAAESAHSREIVQKDFFNLSLAFSESFLLSLRENWGTTLSLYIHIIHTHYADYK